MIAELSSLLHEGYLEEIREAAAATKNAAPAPPAPRIVTPHAGPAVLPCAAATVLLDPLFRDPARLT